MKTWHENGLIDETELISRILITCKEEIPILKEKLIDKEYLLDNNNDTNKNTQNSIKNISLITKNWKNAILETRRQYDAIDRALEVKFNFILLYIF